MKWISIHERLPEDRKLYYLVFIQSKANLHKWRYGWCCCSTCGKYWNCPSTEVVSYWLEYPPNPELSLLDYNI